MQTEPCIPCFLIPQADLERMRSEVMSMRSPARPANMLAIEHGQINAHRQQGAMGASAAGAAGGFAPRGGGGLGSAAAAARAGMTMTQRMAMASQQSAEHGLTTRDKLRIQHQHDGGVRPSVYEQAGNGSTENQLALIAPPEPEQMGVRMQLRATPPLPLLSRICYIRVVLGTGALLGWFLDARNT